jgi:hypothetical protein
MLRVFVIRGFGTKKDSAGRDIDFERVHAELIAPALERCSLSGGTTGEVVDAGNIRTDMFALILEADLVVCDITVHNANVFYELGIRHALRKKHTVLIKGDPSADATPFDLSTDRYLRYPVPEPGQALEKLVATIQGSLRSVRDTDSPIFLMLPSLAEADPSEVRLVPLDFIEEVERAEAAKDRGWLRVIAEDLGGQRYQWEGLRRVAKAQWSLKDTAGARENWEAMRKAQPQDIEANLALANIYEREFRRTRRETLLESSNQAIRQVLDAERITPAQRAEALALQGRNLKTLWRGRLAVAADVDAALRQSLDARALQSFDSYNEAFACDLNAFWPGLAALQMGHILARLATLPGWRNLFKGDQKKAERRRQDLEAELPALAHVVAASIQRARAQEPASEDDRLWSSIAEADLLFLTTPERDLTADPSDVVQAYVEAIPSNNVFAWDAAGGQLELFQQLGIRAAAVRAIKAAFAAVAPGPSPASEHLVVFAGHRIDLPGEPRRFPAAAEAAAREQIAAHLQAFQRNLATDERLTVLASAALGADLLAHEMCRELRIKSQLCLPMPAEDVSRLAFPAGDSWRARFLAVVKEHEQDLLQLSDDAELPRWLQGRAGVDPWERGNRWVMQLADSWGAQQVTLLALWDGQDDGRNGGTAQMVRMARAAGNFRLEVIDTHAWLAQA